MVNDVSDVIAQTLGLEFGTRSLNASTPLFGSMPELNSLAVVKLAQALEDRFGFTIEDDDFTADISRRSALWPTSSRARSARRTGASVPAVSGRPPVRLKGGAIVPWARSPRSWREGSRRKREGDNEGNDDLVDISERPHEGSN